MSIAIPTTSQEAYDRAVLHGQHNYAHYMGLLGRVEMKAPCNILVFGAGMDTPLYCLANERSMQVPLGAGKGFATELKTGKVFVLETAREWIEQARAACDKCLDRIGGWYMDGAQLASELQFQGIVPDLIVVDPPLDQLENALKLTAALRDEYTWIFVSRYQEEGVKAACRELLHAETQVLWKAARSGSRVVGAGVWGTFPGKFERRPEPAAAE